MSFRTALLLLAMAASLCGAEKIVIGGGNARKTRMFSIFNIINFPNTQCTTLSSANTNLVMFGVCLTSDDCLNTGGKSDGNCASGFGVCCMYSTSNCGSTITRNMTYIQNPGFPGAFGTTGTCMYTFQANKDICQIRLDYNILQVADPDNAGNCQLATSDNVVVTTPSGANPPVICGFNTGQHIYIETDKQTGAGTLTFQLNNPTTAVMRMWKIRVVFLECSSTWRAPPDCLQYMTGTTGAFKSFNYQTTNPQMLASQNYNVCVRQNEGYCVNNYSTDNSNANLLNPFKLDNAAVSKRVGCTDTNPMQAFISIPSIVYTYMPTLGTAKYISNSENFCGSYLNTISGTGSDGIVPSQIAPFLVGVFAPTTPAIPTGIIGFALKYAQVAC